ncbi:fused MFS/spermidine synthase [Methylotuvimicrobium sp.]|uniref:fused MFS/spermidine synthase n=1 Tax=Methylotuvimicrobium sp. TaxID=2822413 RepID=UPI003D65E382
MASFVAVVLLFLSGVAGLGYQLVWTRMFAVGLGHELTAMLAVVAAFFGGLTLGAFVLDKWVSVSRRPALWYAGLELIIGLWALVSAFVIPTANDWARAWLGVEPGLLHFWFVAFLVPFFALLPATLAMGATLPAADRWLAQIKADPRQIALAYSVNTAGAVLGVLVASYALMPLLGYRQTLFALAFINALVALSAGLFYFLKSELSLPEKTRVIKAHKQPLPLFWRLLITGFLGIAYEVVTVRVMAQVLEGTVYSFAAVLAVYLTGTAIGAGLYHRFGRNRDGDRLLTSLLFSLSLFCLTGLSVLYLTHGLYWWVRTGLGDSLDAVLLAELTVALPVLLPPTLIMGALFSHLAQSARHATGGVGWALGVNMAGGLAAPLVAGVVLVPLLGVQWTLIGIALAYWLLLPKFSILPRWAYALPAILVLLLPGRLQIVTLRPGESVLEYREGAMASVAVIEQQNERNLRVNNRFQMGGTGVRALRLQRMQTHVPMLLHPKPSDVLYLGVATGVTAGAALTHRASRIDAVELVPESLALLPYFSPYNAELHKNPRVRLYTSDARRYVRTSSQQYDVVIGDLFHPGRDGGGLLYTKEHFQAIAERLMPGGLYCQWLPLYQMDEAMLRSVIKTFQSVFGKTEAWLAGFDLGYPSLALIALSGDTARPEAIESTIGFNQPLKQHLHLAAVRSSVQLAGHFLADHRMLADYAEGAPINTDDHPVILFDAPKFTLKRGVASYASFAALLNSLQFKQASALSSLSSDANAEFTERVDAFVKARNLYFATMINHNEDEARALSGYLQSVETSPDFTLAYAQIVSMAIGKAQKEPETARQWLEKLIEIRPEIPGARDVLYRLPGL